MADETSKPVEDMTADAAQSKGEDLAADTKPQGPAEPPYRIKNQYVKDLSFENPKAPEIYANSNQPETRMTLDVLTKPVGGRDVEVAIKVEARAEKDGELAYLLELTYAAVVEVGNVPKEALSALLVVEVPRMLYPFMRQIVSQTTRNGGFSDLLLSPFDFVQIYKQHMAKLQAQQPTENKDQTESKAPEGHA